MATVCICSLSHSAQGHLVRFLPFFVFVWPRIPRHFSNPKIRSKTTEKRSMAKEKKPEFDPVLLNNRRERVKIVAWIRGKSRT